MDIIVLGVSVYRDFGATTNAVRAMAYKDSRAMHNAIIISTVVIGMLMLGMHLTGFLPEYTAGN